VKGSLGVIKRLNAGVFMAGSAKSIQTNRGGMADAELRGIFAKTHSAKKFQILFFYPSIVGYSPARETASKKTRITK
jgi:hypothetical protein